jgi:hypothetical protein
MLNTNRDQLRHSAQTKQNAANALMRGKQTHPAPAVYLSHVALECALKHRILIQLNARHVGDLKRCLPREKIDALFSGSTGHNLHRLGETSALRRCLAAQGKKALLDPKEWKLMGGRGPIL